MSDPPPTTPAEPDVANDVPTLEEVRIISDQQMVFRSSEDTPSSHPTIALKLKPAKSRCKIRKSTPAPPTKGNGRKRFVPSPLPEDKLLRKKLTFGTDDSSCPETPRCEIAIFPVSPGHDEKTSSPGNEVTPATYDEGEESHTLALGHSDDTDVIPPSGQNSGGGRPTVGGSGYPASYAPHHILLAYVMFNTPMGLG